MENVLHVGNLPYEASVDGLRMYFAQCGPVSDVRIVMDRETARSQSFALVTMNSENGAQRAIAQCDGVLFGGRVLRVVHAVGNLLQAVSSRQARNTQPTRPPPPVAAPANRSWAGAGGATSRAAREKAAEPAVRITQQFRERHNMTYELDCSGTSVVIRMFFPLEGAARDEWRVEVKTGGAMDMRVEMASASSRVEALRKVSLAWRGTVANDQSGLDWDAISGALQGVRAL